MIIAIFSYILTFFFIIKHKRRADLKHEKFPSLKFCKDGIIFVSFKKHRLYAKDAKVIFMGNVTYLIKNGVVVIITNVDKIFLKEDYLYFTANGKVKIYFNCSSFYMYFNIDITSKRFSLEQLKRNASLDVLFHLFDLRACVHLNKYISIITQILNIKIENNRISVEQNKFKLPFVLIYKVNGVIKRINIKQTLEGF